MGRVLRADYSQRFLLPPSLDEWVPPLHPVRFVRDFVDALDLTALGIREPKGLHGRPPYAADLLVKVWLFGWMERVRSTRALEKACLQVMPFLWLTGNLHPDHNTIWRFFRNNHKALKLLFKRIVQVAADAGLVGFALHALDGTKMAAVSSNDTALYRSRLEEKLKEIDAVVDAYVQEVQADAAQEQGTPEYTMPPALADAEVRKAKVRAALKRRVEAQLAAREEAEELAMHATKPTEPVSSVEAPTARAELAQAPSDAPARAEASPSMEAPGSAALTAHGDAPRAAMSRAEKLVQEARALKNELIGNIATLDAADTDQLHPNEPDARTMKGRALYAMGYNAQAVVDHDSDLIVACDVVNEQNDQGQMVPLLKQVRETLGRVADQSIADTGYCSSEECAKAEQENLPVIVSTPREPMGQGAFNKAHFQYDAERNVYLCPRGEALLQIGTNKSRASGQPDAIYRCTNTTCPVRSECSRDPRGRKVRRSPFEEALDRQKHKQQDPRMRILLSLRKEIIEHLFGLVKGIDGFRRFTVRGLEKVGAQWALACSAVNLRKLYAFWRRGELVLGARKMPEASTALAMLAG